MLLNINTRSTKIKREVLGIGQKLLVPIAVKLDGYADIISIKRDLLVNVQVVMGQKKVQRIKIGRAVSSNQILKRNITIFYNMLIKKTHYIAWQILEIMFMNTDILLLKN